MAEFLSTAFYYTAIAIAVVWFGRKYINKFRNKSSAEENNNSQEQSGAEENTDSQDEHKEK